MGPNSDAWSVAFERAMNENKYVTFKKLGKIHTDLPELMASLMASQYNDGAYQRLADSISTGGLLGARSQEVPEIEEEDTAPVQTEYTRPNGETYFARPWGHLMDVTVLQKACKHSHYVLLYGPPGTGKTALFEAAFGEASRTIIMTGDTAERDLVGQFIPNESGEGPEYMWKDGPLLEAMDQGIPLLVDEVGLGDPKVLSVLYGAMDGRREVIVSSNPSRGVVKAKEGFYVVGATNPNAPGVVLSEALQSRFTVHVEVTTDLNVAQYKLGVPEDIVNVAISMNKSLHANPPQTSWAPQMRELIAFRDLENLFGSDFAVANLLAVCPDEAKDDFVEKMKIVYGKIMPARI